MYTGLPDKAASKKMNAEDRNVVHKQTTATKEEPVGPSTRPNIPAAIDPINGKKTQIKYIFTCRSMRNCTEKFGVKGFEPMDIRTKSECLTTWLHPKITYLYQS